MTLLPCQAGSAEIPTAWPHELVRSAVTVRKAVAEALHRTEGGHYGGSFSATDLLVTLYARHLRIDRGNVRDTRRDRFVLSKGHAAIALYAVLHHRGLIDVALDGYASFGSPLEGHPDMTALPGVDWSTGSLGQGLSAALGMALGLDRYGARVWTMLGDGECQEGQVWEAAMLAGLVRPGNLHVIVDVNRRQEFGWRLPGGPDVLIDPVPDLAAKWEAFGWRVLACDGHDVVAIDRTCRDAVAGRGPSVILAATVKGRGTQVTQADPARFHCTAVTVQEHAAMLAELARA